MIDILMATYNGEKFLQQQLDSIINQSYQNWTLIVRDDCSKDKTIAIIEKYQERYPGKIILLKADKPSGAAQNNFFELIRYEREYRTADYIMFADQDDVWLPEKIKATMAQMKKMEQKYSKEMPLLVHTDLKVVDGELNLLNRSLFEMQKMDHRRDKLNNILVQNIVTGCTMMVNRALLSKVETMPQQAIMHDMWLALVAAAFGKIGFVKKATMLYRQHGKNANGAKNVRSLKYFVRKVFGTKEIHAILVMYYTQAAEFYKLYKPQLQEEQREMLKAFSSLEDKNIIRKIFVMKKYHLFKKGIVRKLGQILC